MTPFLLYELQQEIFEFTAQAYPECAPRLALVSSHIQSWYTPRHPMSPDCINIQSIGLNPSYTELSSSAFPWLQSNHSSIHFEVDHVPSSANGSSTYILRASSEQTTRAIYCPHAQAHWPSNVGLIPTLVYQGCTSSYRPILCGAFRLKLRRFGDILVIQRHLNFTRKTTHNSLT